LDDSVDLFSKSYHIDLLSNIIVKSCSIVLCLLFVELDIMNRIVHINWIM